jgi:hypothetical protein
MTTLLHAVFPETQATSLSPLVPLSIAIGAAKLELLIGRSPAATGVNKMFPMTARRTVDTQIMMTLESLSVAGTVRTGLRIT